MKSKWSHWSTTVLKPSRGNGGFFWIMFRVQGLIICSWRPCPPGSWFYSLSHPSFLVKGNICLQPSSLIRLLHAIRILGFQQPLSIWFPLSLSLQTDSVSAEMIFSGTSWTWLEIRWILLLGKVTPINLFQIILSLPLAPAEMAEDHCPYSSQAL